MIDFSTCPIDPFRMYGGGNGNKIGIIYEGVTYMLKFSPKEKTRVHYTNACLSEYLACHIYELLGIEAQERLPVRYAEEILSYDVESTQREDIGRSSRKDRTWINSLRRQRRMGSCVHSRL